MHSKRSNTRTSNRIFGELLEGLNKDFSAEYCLAPNVWHNDCAGRIIGAHTVPVSTSLSKIAREGHVYVFGSNDFEDGSKDPTHCFKWTGIRKASTFRGFCQKHDDQIFAPIEKRPFIANREQCALLAYRALALELYFKSATLPTYHRILKLSAGHSPLHDLALQRIESATAAVRLAETKKGVLDRAIVNRDFSCIEAYIIELDEPPPVMCSTMFNPEEDFSGTLLQSGPDHLITVTSFCSGNSSLIVFAWIAEDDATCRKLVSSLDRIPNSNLTDAFLRLLFEHSEKVYVQPDWWDGLRPAQKVAITKMIIASTRVDYERPPNYLMGSTLGIKPWEIRSRKWLDASHGNE